MISTKLEKHDFSMNQFLAD